MANAVLDGVDGILLGAETLRGKYPVETVQTVLAICHQAEKVFDHNYHFEHLMQVCADSLVHTLHAWGPGPLSSSPPSSVSVCGMELALASAVFSLF